MNRLASVWLDDHGLEEVDLTPYGIRVGDDSIVVPIKTPLGVRVGDFIRMLEGEVKFVYRPKRTRPRMTLWGLDTAFAAARREGYLVLVEGFSDVLALRKSGIMASVALMGSAISKTQAALASLRSERIIVWGDGDEAGEALLKTVADAGFWRPVMGVSVTGMDPSDFCRVSDPSLLIEEVIEYLPDYSEVRYDPSCGWSYLLEREGSDNGRTDERSDADS